MESCEVNDVINSGLKEFKGGNIDQAIQIFGDILRKDEDNAQAHSYIAAAYSKKGDKLHAIRHFEEAVRLDESAKAYFNLGAMYEQTHRIDEAVRQYRMALEMDPNYTRANDALNLIKEKFKCK